MENIYVITKNGIVLKNEANDGFIREISSKADLEEVIERMPYIQTIKAPTRRLRRELYDLAMEKYDDLEWVKIIKSVYIRMKDRNYEDYEPEYMQMAKQFLYGEISIRFDVDMDETEQFVCNEVERHMKEY